MFVRLAFAVAINIEPEILIVDEALLAGTIGSDNPHSLPFVDRKAYFS